MPPRLCERDECVRRFGSLLMRFASGIVGIIIIIVVVIEVRGVGSFELGTN